MPSARDTIANSAQPGASRRRRSARRRSRSQGSMRRLIIQGVPMRNWMPRLVLAVIAAVLFTLSCSGGGSRPASRFQKKMVILGFDGMDPHLLERYLAEGKLPHIAALAKR